MSRSYHQKHPTAHNPHNRIPNPFRDKEGDVRRDRAIRPYGYKGWCGWGGEMYFKKFGEIMVDLVNIQLVCQRLYLYLTVILIMINIDELIKQAMKSKNSDELRAYKNLKAEIQLLKTAKNAKPYDEAAEIQLISKMCKRLEEDIRGFSEAHRKDLESECRSELEVLKKLLPEPVGPSEIMLGLWEWAGQNNFLVPFNENPNNFSQPKIPKKEMGNAIKHLKSKFPQADGKMISNIVKEYII